MSATAFQALAVGCADVLKAAPALASGHVKANPTRPWALDVKQCISVRLAGAQRVSSDACGDHWQVTLDVECEARADTGTDPAEAVDALLAATALRLAQADLSAYAVLQREPEASVDWQFDAAETPLVSATYRLALLVHTELDRFTPSTP